MDAPLVSLLTPTFNRREFFPRAVRCFLSQDYPNLELIILDDGTDPIKDLLLDDPRIKYFYETSKKNHGEKMNICCERATGEILMVFDDDDWYAPDRVTRQAIPFADPAIMVTGTSTLYYYRHNGQQAWQYSTPKNVGWLASIAFRKSHWERLRFDSIAAGADYNLLKKTPAEARCDLNDPALVCASVHDTNACRKALGNEYKPVSWGTIKALIGSL